MRILMLLLLTGCSQYEYHIVNSLTMESYEVESCYARHGTLFIEYKDGDYRATNAVHVSCLRKDKE